MSTSISPGLRGLGRTSWILAALAPLGAAQGINVDFNDTSAGPLTPSSAYGAAGTPGVWNAVTVPATNLSLRDKSGASSGVTVTTDSNLSADLWSDNANMNGDDALLLEDIIYGGSPGAFYPITFNGITNGAYDVFTYAIAPDNKTGYFTDVDVNGSGDGVQTVGGSSFSGHALGVSYARHFVIVTNNRLTVKVAVNSGFISLNGIQLEPAGDPGASDCDCTSANGPCFSFGGPGRGCPNSNPNGLGAMLVGSGVASVFADSFGLSVTDAAPSKPGLILAGSASLGPTGLATVPDSAGLLCVGGMTRRGAVVMTDASGAASFPDFQGAPYSASDLVSAGASVSYTCWFRDPGTAFGCIGDTASSDFNFSNGWTAMWQ